MRRPGRPMRERKILDQNLAAFGGLREFVLKCDASGDSATEIMDKLLILGKVRVHRATVSRWLLEWTSGDGFSESRLRAESPQREEVSA